MEGRKEKRKTETEMGELREERFGGSGVENENEGLGGVETVGGDGSETGLVMKEKGKQK